MAFPLRPIYVFNNNFFPLFHIFDQRKKNLELKQSFDQQARGVEWWQSQDADCGNGFYGQGSFRSSGSSYYEALDTWGDISYCADKTDQFVSCHLEISQNLDFWDRYLSITIEYPTELNNSSLFASEVEKFFNEIEALLFTKITLDCDLGVSSCLKIEHEDVKTELVWRNYANS